MGVGGQCCATTIFSLENIPMTHLIWGWVGPRTGLDRRRKSNRHFLFFVFTAHQLVPRMHLSRSLTVQP
jgi:hypothetical protein